MRFPAVVDDPQFSEEQRASERLKYILRSAALRVTGKASVRELARTVGRDHSTLCLYVRRGEFTERCARHMEETLGRDVIRADHLRRPLEIEAE